MKPQLFIRHHWKKLQNCEIVYDNEELDSKIYIQDKLPMIGAHTIECYLMQNGSYRCHWCAWLAFRYKKFRHLSYSFEGIGFTFALSWVTNDCLTVAVYALILDRAFLNWVNASCRIQLPKRQHAHNCYEFNAKLYWNLHLQHHCSWCNIESNQSVCQCFYLLDTC